MGEERWQRLTKGKWSCFSAANSGKISQARELGSNSLRIWDGGIACDIDFVAMRRMPGRQPIRLCKPPPEEGSQESLPWLGEHGSMTIADWSKLRKAKEQSVERRNEKIRRRDATRAAAPAFAATTSLLTPGASAGRTTAEMLLKDKEMFLTKLASSQSAPALPRITKDAFVGLREERRPSKGRVRRPSMEALYRTASTTRRGSFSKAVQEVPSGFKAIVHPAFNLLREPPHFHFHKSAELAEREVGLRRELDAIRSDNALEKVVCLSRHYAEKLQDPMEKNPLLLFEIRGLTPVHIYAALALALYMCGAASCADCPHFWTLSSGKGRPTQQAMPPPPRPSGLLPSLLRTGMVPRKPEPPPPGYVAALPIAMEESTVNRAASLKLTKAWKEAQQATAACFVAGIQTIPQQNGSFDWIGFNELEARLARLKQSCATMLQVHSLSLDHSCFQRRSYLRHRWKCSNDSNQQTPKMIGRPHETSLEAAIAAAQKQGQAACAVCFTMKGVNMGSAFTAGLVGDELSELCVRSDLFDYLRNANFEAVREGAKLLPEDGCLFIEDVHVFRHDAAEGFKPMGRLLSISLAVVELENLNPLKTGDADTRARVAKFDYAQYAERLEERFEAAIQCAMEAKIEVMAISDSTCRELQNSVEVFAKALGKAVARIRNAMSLQVSFPAFLLGGSSDFVVHTREAYRNALRYK
eukprot:TRINITY_DN19568_c0_g1_i1.p1 TRINITY_DN19568_c0_g1~~TRINITY_DN19568_c0_g1_i1.p1  ORF type:complete len:698 (-),score=154.33 TRINITY_DN19568_c0_g1_i1:137-2230(-)